MPATTGRFLRILHVLAPADFGGLERVVFNLVIGQRERGHSVHVLMFLDPGRTANHPLARELTHHGVDVQTVEIPPRRYLHERRALDTALDRFRPYVVHFHGARVDVLDAPVARRAGYRTITTVHGFTGGDRKNRLYEFLQKRSMRRADAVVAVAATQMPTLVAAGVPAERIHVVPNAWRGNGAPLDRRDARERIGLPADAGPVVGWIGRLTHEKGADVFLDGLKLVTHGVVTAVIVGGGPQREVLQRRASLLGLADRVRWVGALEHAAAILRAFDVFVMSSRTEGTPIVLFEAIAADVPVVATSVGGIPDVVGPGGAILVEPERPAALAAAIDEILADGRAARERSGAAKTRLSTGFAPEPWLDRHEEIYRQAMR